MEKKPRPTVDELVRRVEVMENALETMFNAFRDDLVALREDLKRIGPDVAGAPSPRREPAPTAVPTAPLRRGSGLSAPASISEQPARPAKKDPRSE